MKIIPKLSPFQRVIIGLILGVFTGLFFGEIVAPLKIAGDIYIRLLQMTVLPYVLVSIISGLGRLDTHLEAVSGGRALLWPVHEGQQNEAAAN